MWLLWLKGRGHHEKDCCFSVWVCHTFCFEFKAMNMYYFDFKKLFIHEQFLTEFWTSLMGGRNLLGRGGLLTSHMWFPGSWPVICSFSGSKVAEQTSILAKSLAFSVSEFKSFVIVALYFLSSGFLLSFWWEAEYKGYFSLRFLMTISWQIEMWPVIPWQTVFFLIFLKMEA